MSTSNAHASTKEVGKEEPTFFELMLNEYCFGAVQYVFELILKAAEETRLPNGVNHFSKICDFRNTLPKVFRKRFRRHFDPRFDIESYSDAEGNPQKRVVIRDCSLSEFVAMRGGKYGDARVGQILLVLSNYRSKFPERWRSEMLIRAFQKSLKFIQQTVIDGDLVFITNPAASFKRGANELFKHDPITIEDTRRLMLMDNVVWSEIKDRERYVKENLRPKGYGGTAEEIDKTLKSFRGFYQMFTIIMDKNEKLPESWVELTKGFFDE